jgi:hypothetical protein
MTGPRDWDKELAEIDKVIERGSGAPPQPRASEQPGVARPAAIPGPTARASRRSVALTWLWTSLALALALALLVWPYDKGCGIRLVFFLGAAGMTGLAGLIGAVSAWAHRRALAHVISLLVIGWAAVMAGREVLPRTGYAKQTATWTCPSQIPGEPAPTTSNP